jgi:hypothetical protein
VFSNVQDAEICGIMQSGGFGGVVGFHSDKDLDVPHPPWVMRMQYKRSSHAEHIQVLTAERYPFSSHPFWCLVNQHFSAIA